MNHNQALFESLFRRNINDPLAKNFLAEVTAAHPYFSPAQFFLLQQTTEGTEAFDRQAEKTNIFFNNPLWLNFQLQLTKPGMALEEKKYEVPVQELTATRITHEPEVIEETEPIKEESPVTESIHEIYTEPEPLKEVLPVQELTATRITHEPEVIEETETIKEESPVTESMHDIYTEPEPLKEVLPVQELTATRITHEPEVIEETEPIKEESPVTESIHDIYTEPEPLKEVLPVHEIIDEQETEEEPGPEPMKIELKLREELVTNDDALVFEPMHLVDYFASQGIKLSEEVQSSGDKLGKQLKSFTEWLKTMKKVHALSPGEGEAVQSDKSVEAMAEMSNRENEVITEAMAEVFARQGKTAKATEVYQKLSLLNPAKSAYFAAKIETLKGA